jgi:DNA modification methylase
LDDYRDRTYLSAIEAAKYLGIAVKDIHRLTREKVLDVHIATSGQKRYALEDLQGYQAMDTTMVDRKLAKGLDSVKSDFKIKSNDTVQRIIIGNSMKMTEVADDSINLMITSPPYYNAKMYSTGEALKNDLGNIHDLDEWFTEIGKVWSEVYRVLQPGRKAFINIMNLPVRGKGTFRSLNLVGRTVDLCEELGFIFKRDIIWHKTNGVKAHFGTFPYPGGILLNHMHEFILEFQKPSGTGYRKYAHVSADERERSKLDKDFWLELKNSDVWLMNPERSGDKRSHVAPFPYTLPYRLIRGYSFIGETVLDPFMGSGTVLRAASDLGRNGIGYEIHSEIARSARDSLERGAKPE